MEMRQFDKPYTRTDRARKYARVIWRAYKHDILLLVILAVLFSCQGLFQ
jgi:hypothetical protein